MSASNCQNKKENNNSKTLTAIIAEDEHPLAMVLKKALNKLWPELTIVKVCHDGREAQSALNKHKVDIAFLDIAMPYKTGLELAEYCALENIETLVVLVTAYPEHALDAFKFNVCDYLLKPLCKNRLAETIKRLKLRLSVIDTTAKSEFLTHLYVQKGRFSQQLDINDICCFISEQKYVKVVTTETTFLISKTLSELEKELDQKQFWRIHRNSIVNTKQIQYRKKTLTGRLILTLYKSDEKLTVSRAHLHKFKEI